MERLDTAAQQADKKKLHGLTSMAECVLSSARSSTKHSNAFDVDGRVMSR